MRPCPKFSKFTYFLEFSELAEEKEENEEKSKEKRRNLCSYMFLNDTTHPPKTSVVTSKTLVAMSFWLFD
jgi:hypothetical protein